MQNVTLSSVEVGWFCLINYIKLINIQWLKWITFISLSLYFLQTEKVIICDCLLIMISGFQDVTTFLCSWLNTILKWLLLFVFIKDKGTLVVSTDMLRHLTNCCIIIILHFRHIYTENKEVIHGFPFKAQLWATE